MSIEVSDYGRENYGIVVVDAEKFLRLWRAEPNSIHRAEANGTPETWPSDYKYKYAVDGFSHGRENPVPLADVCFGTAVRTTVSYRYLCFGRRERHEQFSYVAFNNGITRTIWLLTQGCTSFPVKCEVSSARGLFLIAGAEGTEFRSLGELAQTLDEEQGRLGATVATL